MMLARPVPILGRGSKQLLDVAKIFSAKPYTGDGAARSIVNGLDNAGQGGLVWTKRRDTAIDHQLYDTVRGANVLVTDTTAAQLAISTGVTSFTASGYTLGTQSSVNANTGLFVGWNFRQHPRFLSIVQYTGDGVAGRKIAHTLDASVSVGMVIIKRLDSTTSWQVWHRGLTAGNFIVLSATAAQQTTSAATLFGNGTTTVDPDFTGVTVGAGAGINASGATYIMYVFAHDTASDGVIQCGSFTTDSAGNASVNVGWAPQFGLFKNRSTGTWRLLDTARGWTYNTDANLSAEATTAEATNSDFGQPTATGFTVAPSMFSAAANTGIYMVIREVARTAPFASPSTLFAANLYTYGSNNVVNNGIDNLTYGGLVWDKGRSAVSGHAITDTVRGVDKYLRTDLTDPQNTAGGGPGVTAFSSSGYTTGSRAATTAVGWNFRQHPRFLSIVQYTGNGVAGRKIAHTLSSSVSVGMVIIKRVDAAGDWTVWHRGLTAGNFIVLNTTAAQTTTNIASFFGDGTSFVAPDNTGVTIGAGSQVNSSSATYIMYVFAHDTAADGIIQCGSHASAGVPNIGWQPQFLLSKMYTTATGANWFMLDTARGWGSGADPVLLAHLTNAETSATDYGAPTLDGFGTTTGLASAANSAIYMAIRGLVN